MVFYHIQMSLRKKVSEVFIEVKIQKLTTLGYSISVFCIPLFHTIYFPLYEKTKLYFKDTYGWHDDSFKLYSISAGISGLFCNVVTNPFWVVRTRM